jgi:hypothetical protein
MGDELARLIGAGVLNVPADVVFRDRDLIDLAVLQIGLELAVVDRDYLLLISAKEVLEQQHAGEGGDDVPEVELGFLVHCHGQSPPTGRRGRIAFRMKAPASQRNNPFPAI